MWAPHIIVRRRMNSAHFHRPRRAICAQDHKARAERVPAFRKALLTEAVEQLIAGEVEVGKAVLRDYINATVGFERLAKATGTPSKSLMRMLGPKGNPRANILFAMLVSFSVCLVCSKL
jgi:DNA-binding phage protein